MGEDGECLPKIDIDEINLYPEMNKEIAWLLKIRNNDIVSMYAAKLIEHLQKRVAIEVEDDEVVIAIKKSPRRDISGIDFVALCLDGEKKNGWCYRIVRYSATGNCGAEKKLTNNLLKEDGLR